MHYFFIGRQNLLRKPKKLNKKNELIIDFGGKNEIEYIRISILLLQRIKKRKKYRKIKGKGTCKEEFKRRSQISSPRDVIIQRSDIKMKAVYQNDRKQINIIIFIA